jgi:excisionase family DNA binding protein
MTSPASFEARLPAAREVAAASQGQKALAAVLSSRRTTHRIQVFDERNKAHAVELPTSALRLLVDILSELADGNAVKVVPVHAELTTQEAADLLKVSRPHFVKLLESGALRFHKAGKHRRVRLNDLMAYMAAQEQRSAAAMEELAAQAQALQMGYE